MSPAEIIYRIKKSTQIQLQRYGLCTARKVPAPDLERRFCSFIETIDSIDIDSYRKAADQVCLGDMRVFALENAKLGKIPDWNRDPASGTRAPLVFGKSLNYRDPRLVGDIKYLWEPNRHLQLVVLAQVYSRTREGRYLENLRLLLESWLDQCPYLMGPNWTSSLELGIRLINWSLVWQLVGGKESALFNGDEGKRFQDRWLRSIYQHAHFIAGHQSRYSSANNHLIGEAAGLFIAAVTWPFWDISTAWRKQAMMILEEEIMEQNAPDGVNREQAISYQQFVLDFMLISALAGRANGLEFSSQFWGRIERMMEYLASIMDVRGNLPMIGDADDGYVVSLSRENNWCPYRSLLATGAILFRRGEFKAKAGALDDKSCWLLGPEARKKYEEIQIDKTYLPISREFPEGGYYILGEDLEAEDEIRLIVDAGPLGYRSIAAHGHADALAFTLSVGGTEFLVDPGTYAYHTQKIWRDYFRGTSAHNTIRVDGLDQSVSGGNFMWLQKAGARCEHWQSNSETDQFIGSHDGYSRLTDSVLHRREIILIKSRRRIEVTDYLSCQGNHRIECFWHFSESCTVGIIPEGLQAVSEGKCLTLTFPGTKNEPQLYRGDDCLPLGWVSRRYDVKLPAYSARLDMNITGDTAIRTVIACE